MATHDKKLDLKPLPHQSGAVLVISILVLLVLTILGVASMSSSTMQERMAGNARLEAEAFEAASAGVSDSLNYVISQFADPTALPDAECGALGHDGWTAVVDGEEVPQATGWTDPPVDVGDAHYQLRMYCLVDQTPPDPTDTFCVANPDQCGQPRSQLFVESRGQRMVGGEAIAERGIEVRIGLVARNDVIDGDGCGAMCFPGGTSGDLAFPTSNAFAVDGEGGPAITTGYDSDGEDSLAVAIEEAIRPNRIGNYDGGIAANEIGSPWESLDLIDEFRQLVAAAASATDTAYTNENAGEWPTDGNPEFVGPNGEPQITYFDGDVNFSGTPSGEGIMVIDGNLTAGGTPEFNGLLVVLGGSYNITGGGTGGGPAGSLVIVGAEEGSVEFGNFNADLTGGGNALYAFNCENLRTAESLLEAAGMGEGLWAPECEEPPPANLVDAEDTHYRILSWRENIGWREANEFGLGG